MKYLKIISILFIIFSCKNNSKTELKNSTKDTLTTSENLKNSKPKTKEKKSFLFPFGYELSNLKLDSINEYGVGDCWGDIRKVSERELSISIDSMNCGDYGFEYTFYLLNNDLIKTVHSKESQTLIYDNFKNPEYLLTETIYDFRKKPFILYSRKDTVQSPNFELIKTKFDMKNIENSESELNKLTSKYEQTWRMIIDN